MASQHTANVPSAQARLGSIPRLSAKVRVSGGYGWPRLPVKAECSLGASRFKSGGTHQTLHDPIVSETTNYIESEEPDDG